MRPVHFLAIGIGIVLIGVLYWGGNTRPPAKKAVQAPNATMPSPGRPTPASIDSLYQSCLQNMSPAQADSVRLLAKKCAALHDSAQMRPIFSVLSEICSRARQPLMAAFFNSRNALLENSEKSLTFAGQLFLQLAEDEKNLSVQAFEAGEALKCLEKSLSISPENEDTRLALATCYVELTGEPMRGVQILLAITKEHPDDVRANVLLGRMAIQSGQFAKAVSRLEGVVKRDPQNKEALYFLAQAYEGAGERRKAADALEQCKRLVNDPDFSREIDEKINSLR